MSDVTDQNQADDEKVVAWKTWVVTSAAAILTGFAAYYFICAESWGGSLMEFLQGKKTIGGHTLTGSLFVR